MSSSLIIKKLILVGARKNYIIPFNSGVNIIYGDSDTGKSSILEFINYLFGSGSIELADEIASSVEYAALEIFISNALYTFKRNIFDYAALIEVFPCAFDECSNFIPDKYSPNFKILNAPNGFFSDFLFDALNFPKVQIKVSPTQESSQIKRLSFRNLFKFCYLNQDDVGSKSFLDLGNYSKFTTNKEVFKYIFNVLDSSITELEAEISEKATRRNSEKQKYDAVSDFLRETGYESLIDIDDSIEGLDGDIENLKLELHKLNSSMVSDSDNYQNLKSIFNELTLNHKNISEKIKSTQETIDKYTRLKHDYDNDISKIESIKIAKERLGEKIDVHSKCPICDNEFEMVSESLLFDLTSVEILEGELKSLVKRRKNISDLLGSQAQKYKQLLKDIAVFDDDISKARNMIDVESQEMITPYLSERDLIIQEISALEQKRKSYVESLKIRNQQEKIYRSFKNLEESLEKLNERLAELKMKSPSISTILEKLSNFMKDYFVFINIKNRHGIEISDKTFLPLVRQKEYIKITSGGLRTITSIGYMLNILKYSIENEINYPNFMMIDTVGKYLGKSTKNSDQLDTDIQEDIEEGLSDPLKYQNIYEGIIEVTILAEEKGKNCQIILVDNDVPEAFVESYKGFIVAHYDSTGANGLQVGLIDDIPHLENK